MSTICMYILCWPKNVVKGCVIRGFNHATSDPVVFWLAEFITSYGVGHYLAVLLSDIVTIGYLNFFTISQQCHNNQKALYI